MLAAVSGRGYHSLKNIGLLILSFVFLPIDTLILFWAFLSDHIIPSPIHRRRNASRRNRSFKTKTILVTGVGMTKGLTVARIFYEAGHNVIGVDFKSDGTLAAGWVSKSLKKFYSLQRPDPKTGSANGYIGGLLEIVVNDRVDLWVSCSGVASATEDGEAKEVIEARTKCKAIQFDVATTKMLHEKHSFIERTKEIGLTVPETYTITSCAAAEAILRDAPKDRKYIMKPIGMDDANRGDMTLLPKFTVEETTQHLSKLEISKGSPWILQQFIKGPEYCTHSLVARGQVKAFVACPSAELLMHYDALPFDCKLSQAMLRFTQTFATKGGKNFTGHLSFDFMVDQSQTDGCNSICGDEEPVLYPIECNPRAHTAVALFNGTPSLPDAYLCLLEASSPKSCAAAAAKQTARDIVTPKRKDKYFWTGHDLVELPIRPFWLWLTLQGGISVTPLIRNTAVFLEHVLFWRDGTFERWDPAPWWWLYHVYWPMQLWSALRDGKRWSRLNVSTTKMFEC